MKPDRKSERMAQIEDAAYAVICEKGFAGASMLSIAKRARASNETMYAWYGDKLGLFSAMVNSNATRIRALLEEALDQADNPMDTLDRLGPLLLEMLTGDRAIALNQAAAADPTGQLGQALSKAGRDSVAPLIGKTLERARQSGDLSFDATPDATELYLGLLIGDLQLRCVTGQVSAPDAAARVARARRATENLKRILR